jgi:hypothetical protein
VVGLGPLPFLAKAVVRTRVPLGDDAAVIEATAASWAYCAVTMSWDLRHRKTSVVIRLLLAVWITVVVVVLCATGRWWGLVFVVPLVLDLYLLRRRDGGVAR